MKVKSLAVLMMVGMMLAACSGEKRTPFTGGYGSAALSGQVTMAGTANPSPQGVRVSVRGTGMTTVLGPNGQFAFIDVPESAEIDFSRASDGVQATMQVEDPSAFLSVELTTTTATRTSSSRRRGVGRGTDPVYEIEGTIVRASAGEVVIFTSKKVEQTVKLTPETVIRKGNGTGTPADLVAGARIHVKAKKVADVLTAIVVILQKPEDDEEDERPELREYEGIVRSASATQLVVFTSKKVEETFVVNAETIIRKGGTPIAAADIQAGWRVHVKAATADGGATKTAKLVIVQNTKGEDDGEEVEIEGTVASVGTDQLVVTTPGGPVTVKTTSATRIRDRRNAPIGLSDIRVGDRVEAEGRRLDAGTIEAKSIKVED
jgi:hypothetical protein